MNISKYSLVKSVVNFINRLRKSPTLILVPILVICNLLYFSGVSLRLPITVSDWEPFPKYSVVSNLSDFLGIYRNININMQFIIGTGWENIFTPFYFVEMLFVLLFHNSALSQMIFLISISIFSGIGAMLLFNSIMDEKYLGILSGIIYGVSPVLLINMFVGGNPYGAWWYMLIPWFLLSSILFIERTNTRSLILLLLILTLNSFLTPESLLFMSLFLGGPVIITYLFLYKRYIASLLQYIIILAISSLLLGFVLNYPSFSLTADTASTFHGLVAFNAYHASLTNPIALLLSFVPNLGFELYTPPYHFVSINPYLLFYNWNH